MGLLMVFGHLFKNKYPTDAVWPSSSTRMESAFCAGLTWCGTLQTLGLTLKSETVVTTKESGGKTTVSSTTKTTKKV